VDVVWRTQQGKVNELQQEKREYKKKGGKQLWEERENNGQALP
jgi:hypothetical protein